VLDAGGARTRDQVMQELAETGVETRPFFHPMHTLPMYATTPGQRFPVAERLSAYGFNLPSSANLSESDIDYVCERLLQLVG